MAFFKEAPTSATSPATSLRAEKNAVKKSLQSVGRQSDETQLDAHAHVKLNPIAAQAQAQVKPKPIDDQAQARVKPAQTTNATDTRVTNISPEKRKNTLP